jgi:phospholipid-transporting ATPase
MSVIVKDKGLIKIYVKGADSIIIDRLNKTVNQPFLKKNEHHIQEFSKLGLRTLAIAMKIISEQEY